MSLPPEPRSGLPPGSQRLFRRPYSGPTGVVPYTWGDYIAWATPPLTTCSNGFVRVVRVAP